MKTQHIFTFSLIIFIFYTSIYNALGCDKGDKAFKNLKIQTAIAEYSDCLKHTPDDKNLLERLGDCYLILDNYALAESYYEKMVDKTKYFQPVMMKYAMCLNATGKTAEYDAYVQSLLKKFPQNKSVLKLIQQWHSTQQSSNYEVKKVLFNSDASDFSPTKMGSKIYFSSNRTLDKKKDGFTGLGYAKIFEFDSTTQSVTPVFTEFGRYNIGTPVFYNHGNEMIFSANEKSKSKGNSYLLKLYHSKKEGGNWQHPTLLPINFKNANNTHPCINDDGTIIVFSSDQIQRNGMDLYVCYKDRNGQWKPAQKLKAPINTLGNEVFPSFIGHQTLVFSSDGIGSPANGLDMYMTTLQNKNWSNPIPLSPPLNSKFDDYGMSSDKEMNSGYFTSNRDQADGTENIYHFSRTDTILLDSIIYEPIEEIHHLISGVVTSDTIKISGAHISIFDAYGNIIVDTITDDLGSFHLPVTESPYYTVVAEKEGHHRSSTLILLQDIDKENGVSLHVEMPTITKGDVFKLDNLYYDYDKWDVSEESIPELESLYDFLSLNPNIKIEISSHTDARGNDAYNLKLSQKRAATVVNYLISHGIFKDRIIAKGYGETQLINHCKNGVSCTDEEHRQNRRTEVKILSVQK